MYLTVQEFINAPTGIDCTNIIPGGTVAQNNAELTNVIRRASSWIDQICKMPSLEATINTETKEVYMNYRGMIRVHPDMIPIITLLDSVQYRVSPLNSWVSLNIGEIEVYERYFTIYNLAEMYVQPEGVQPLSILPYRSPYVKWRLKDLPIMLQYSYINGYPNTTLSSNASAGATSITVQNNTGMVSQTLTIYDNDLTEEVVISSVNGNTVTLVSPLIFNHSAGVAVSALPSSVKQACIILTAFLIQERGSLNISMGEQNIQGVRNVTGTGVDVAKELLKPLVRGVVS
jgi:hypothetical protein